MIEKHILIEDIDPLLLYGVNNTNMQMLKALYPKLRIVARGNVIHVMGDELEMCAFEEIIAKLQKHILKYNSLTEEELLHITRGERSERDGVEGVIVYSVTGRPICARTTNTTSSLPPGPQAQARRTPALPSPSVPSRTRR